MYSTGTLVKTKLTLIVKIESFDWEGGEFLYGVPESNESHLSQMKMRRDETAGLVIKTKEDYCLLLHSDGRKAFYKQEELEECTDKDDFDRWIVLVPKLPLWDETVYDRIREQMLKSRKLEFLTAWEIWKKQREAEGKPFVSELSPEEAVETLPQEEKSKINQIISAERWKKTKENLLKGNKC